MIDFVYSVDKVTNNIVNFVKNFMTDSIYFDLIIKF